MMDFAVAIFLAVVATVVASVIFGKELDEKEKQAIAKEKIESKKEEAQVARKSQGERNHK
jgi:H+/gluconate symporter-like permease